MFVIVLAALAVAVGLAGPAAAQQERRIALVIGIGAYQNVPQLANPMSDAQGDRRVAARPRLRGDGAVRPG